MTTARYSVRALVAVAAMVLITSACGTNDEAEPEGSNEESGGSATAAVAAEPSADQLTVDHGCGFGFAKGSEAQDLGLLITFTGAFTVDGPDLSAPISWPSDQWVGEAQAGSDLFANWCNDVFEAGSPEPVVAESWKIVEGTLTIEDVVANGDVSRVTGQLTDTVLESAGGDRIELDPVTLTNELWGFFAG